MTVSQRTSAKGRRRGVDGGKAERNDATGSSRDGSLRELTARIAEMESMLEQVRSAQDSQFVQVMKFTVLRHIVLPQLAPFLVAATRSGLALIWKIVLVVELLGRSNGVGFQLHLFFQLFDIASILAYTLAFVLVIQVLEYGLLQPLERRINRWRR